jgi:hypothetical protein
MGIAVLRGRELVAYGVHTLRNGERPYDVVGQARGIVLRYIERCAPSVVAIEAPLPIATKRAALLSVIAQELRARAGELKLQVLELPPERVRQIVAGNPRATKMDVAERLVTMGFDALRSRLPRRPVRPALWLSRRDRYWLHLFYALAIAIAAQDDSQARKNLALV